MKNMYAMCLQRLLVFLLMGIGMGACKKDKAQGTAQGIPPEEKKWITTTISGNGEAAFTNGPLVSAQFYSPTDIAVAIDGTIYVTDADNGRIRKISSGQVSTLAGSNNFGFANGHGASARFQYPYSVTLGREGDLYVSDLDPRLRKISPAGDVSTFAGAKDQGFEDGNADTARFYPGNRMAVDAEGNIYSSDTYNCRIRKIGKDGKVITIAGSGQVGFNNGSGIEAQFHFPTGIVIDHQGNLFVADGGNYRIRKITPGGQVSTFAGSGTQGENDGTFVAAQFTLLSDLVIDNNDNLYATDKNRIRKITSQGIVTTIAGDTNPGYKDGAGVFGLFSSPSGLGIDAQGNIYVADTHNNRIRKISFQ